MSLKYERGSLEWLRREYKNAQSSVIRNKKKLANVIAGTVEYHRIMINLEVAQLQALNFQEQISEIMEYEKTN